MYLRVSSRFVVLLLSSKVSSFGYLKIQKLKYIPDFVLKFRISFPNKQYHLSQFVICPSGEKGHVVCSHGFLEFNDSVCMRECCGWLEL